MSKWKYKGRNGKRSLTMAISKFCLLFFTCSFIFSSCNRNSPKAPEVQQVGDFDSSVIAQDTVMQRTLESSYEYAKTLNVTANLVYDIRAYGGSASMGEYAILRRAANNKADTVAKGERDGIIADALTADLNRNGNEEIYIITQSVGSGAYGKVIAWEFDKNGHASMLSLPAFEQASGYMGKDSFFIANNLLVRQYPLYKEADPNCCPTGGIVKEYYALKGEKFESMKNVKSEK